MASVTFVCVHPGHYRVVSGGYQVGTIFRTIRSGLRTWTVRDMDANRIGDGYYLNTAKVVAQHHNWKGALNG